MRDGIEKTVLLLISADFAHKKNGVDQQARDDEAEENDAEDQRDDLTPVLSALKKPYLFWLPLMIEIPPMPKFRIIWESRMRASNERKMLLTLTRKQ